MAGNRRAILEALASVADATPVSWDLLEEPRASDPDARRALRLIASVADIHRTDDLELDDGAGDRSAAPGHPARWNHFDIRRQIGEGGSSHVFVAYEPSLDREVALKLLSTRGASAWSRILHEGRALGRIHHPNVVQVFGADLSHEHVGLWMELVRGRDLDDVVARDGPMGARAAALIAQDVCRALAAVHVVGVVHGDVKAQNVIREGGGRIVLVDFGSWQPRRGPAIARTGTVRYLAPEALRDGQTTVAGDLYALGVLLYFLLSGAYPVDGKSMGEVLAAHARGDRTRLRDRRPDLPDSIIRVVERATAVDPADRYPSAGEFESVLAALLVDQPPQWRVRLKQLAIAAAAIGIAGLATFVFGRRPAVPAAGSGTSIASVAVVPFQTAGTDAEGAYLPEALAGEVTAQLARVPGLHVISTRSSRRADSQSSRDAACATGVSIVATGTMQTSEGLMRVNAELTDCASGRQLWSDTFTGTRPHIFDLQQKVAAGLASALRGRQAGAMEPAARGQMSDEAYDLYLRARYYWAKRDAAEAGTAVELFQQVVRMEPRSALARAGLSQAYLLSALYGVMPREDASRQAQAAAEEAVRLDSQSGEAYTALAAVQHDRWELVDAGTSYRLATELSPNDPIAHHWYAIYLAQAGETAAAQREIQRAAGLDPLSSSIGTMLGIVFHLSQDYERAIAQYQRVVAADPGFAAAHSALAETYTMVGNYAAARASLAQSRALSPAGASRGIEAYILAVSGEIEDARRLLAQADAGLEPDDNGATDIGAAYAVLGDMDRAGIWLNRAFAAHDRALLFGRVEPRYAALRQVPAFARISRGIVFGATPGRQP